MNVEAQALRELFKQRTTSTQAAFARANGLGSASMVWQYLEGRRRLNLPAACKFARGLGVDLVTISSRLDRMVKDALDLSAPRKLLLHSAGPEFVQIPRVYLTVRDGHSGFKASPEPTVTYIAFHHDWLLQRNFSPGNLLAISCPDDGMSPTLMQGDLIVLNVAERDPVEGHAFALNYEGELLIRRLHRDEGEWWLSCDNPDSRRFPRKRFIRKHCFIVARAVYRQSESI